MLKDIHVQSIEAMLDNKRPHTATQELHSPRDHDPRRPSSGQSDLSPRGTRTGVAIEAGKHQPCSLQILNRLSDLLFVCARHIAQTEGIEEVLWEQEGTQS